MIQNFASGSAPNYSDEWRKAAKYSWVISSSSDVRGNLTKLKYKNENNDDKEEKPDPYSWNAQVDLRNVSIKTNSSVKELIKDAHFALVLNYVKMKEKTKESSFKDVNVTRMKREESRIDAAALKLPGEIRKENYERYIRNISKNIKVTSDIKSIRNIFMRVLGQQYAGHYILQGLHFSELDNIMDAIIDFILAYEKKNQEPDADLNDVVDVYSSRISSRLKDAMESTVRYNNNIKNNLDYLIGQSPSEKHTQLVKKIIEVNKAICDKIRRTPLESIEDAVILYGKIMRMREDYRNGRLFKKAFSVSDFNYYLEGNDEERCLRMLNNVSASQIGDILNNFDQYINFLNKL
jgi:hypothetical protein